MHRLEINYYRKSITIGSSN